MNTFLKYGFGLIAGILMFVYGLSSGAVTNMLLAAIFYSMEKD